MKDVNLDLPKNPICYSEEYYFFSKSLSFIYEFIRDLNEHSVVHIRNATKHIVIWLASSCENSYLFYDSLESKKTHTYDGLVQTTNSCLFSYSQQLHVSLFLIIGYCNQFNTYNPPEIARNNATQWLLIVLRPDWFFFLKALTNYFSEFISMQ